MEFSYSNAFKSALFDRTKVVTLFSCELNKSDNNNRSNVTTNIPINISTGRLNEDIYIIEIDYQSIENAKYLVDGIQFSRYNELRLFYDVADIFDNTNISTHLFAGIAYINRSNSTTLIDYAKNYICIDLSPFPINCRIHLSTPLRISVVDSTSTPKKDHEYYYYDNDGHFIKFNGSSFDGTKKYYEYVDKNGDILLPGLTLDHKHELDFGDTLCSSENFFNHIISRSWED